MTQKPLLQYLKQKQYWDKLLTIYLTSERLLWQSFFNMY